MRILKNRLNKDLKIRTQRDFPVEGIEFLDLMPTIMEPDIFESITNNLAEHIQNFEKENNVKIDYIIAPEARGFIYAMPVAVKLKVGVIPVRKKGKLPSKMIATQFQYNKEYGLDRLEMPMIDLNAHEENYGYKGKNFYIIDDIYATGNTINAIKNSISDLGGKVFGVGVVLNIAELNNDEKYAILDVNED